MGISYKTDYYCILQHSQLDSWLFIFLVVYLTSSDVMKANQKWQSFQVGTTLTFPCAMTQEDNVFHNRVLRHWLLEGYQNHGNWQQLLGGSMRPHWETAWEEVTHAQHWDFCSIAHVSERSLVPHKRELCLKCFYMGIFIFYETSKIIGFHMTFSRLLVFVISPQPSPLLCPPIPNST